MQFDRAFMNSQIKSDLFVQLTLDNMTKNLAFTLAKTGKALANLSNSATFLLCFRVADQSSAHGI